MSLIKNVEKVYQCSSCGYCRELVYPEKGTYKVCPAREILGFESSTARGKMNMARAIVEGRLKYSSKGLSDQLYKACLLCANCKAHCPVQVDLPKIVLSMREDVVDSGLSLPKELSDVNDSVVSKHNVFGEEASIKSNLAKELGLSKTGEVLLFAGCYATFTCQEIAKSTAQVLRQADIEASYLAEDEWCCGIPQFFNGSIKTAKEIARHNVEAIKKSGAKQVIVPCAGCYHALKTIYHELMGEVPFEVVHSSEFILRLGNEKKLVLRGMEAVEKVTYHDPCHLGRYEGVYDPPREVIRQIAGRGFVEMQRNRENSWCCGGGAGGVTYVAYRDIAKKVAAERIREAVDAGAKTVVTACPMCETALKPSAARSKIKVVDLSVYVAQNMDLRAKVP